MYTPFSFANRRPGHGLRSSALFATLLAIAGCNPGLLAQSGTFPETTGSIDYPGERETYSFHLPAPATLYFDSLTQDNSLNWTLTGPPGLVASRAFNASDADSPSDPLLRLPDGDYTLIVRGAADATGPYRFRLLNLADALLIQPGTTNGNPAFAPRSTDLYQFVGNNGDVISFDRLTLLNGSAPYWRLVDPYGQVLWHNYFSDVNAFTLSATGTYTLMVESLIGGGSGTNYTFRLAPGGGTPPPAFSGTPLVLGATVSNAVTTVGATNAYTFSLGQKTFLYFDSLIYDSNLRYTLLGPGGIIAAAHSFSGGATYDLHEAPAGDYQLLISAANNDTGSYLFRVLDLSTAQPLTPGQIVTATNSPANSLRAFRFNATPGTRLFFDSLGQSGHPFWGNPYWTLIDPYGNLLFSDAGFGDRATMTLTGNGRYTLWVGGGDQETTPAGTYSFNLVPVTESTTALALNTEYAGAIQSPGQRQVYTFSLAGRKRVYFQSLTNQSIVRWSLEGPSGSVAAQAFNAGGWLAYTLEPGDYRLTVFANGDDTGPYSFKIVDFATSIPTAIGPIISGTVAPARAVVIRDLELAAGDRLFFDALSQSGFSFWGNPFWRLEDSEGNAVSIPELGYAFERSFGDLGPFTVPRAGTYRLLLGGGIQENGDIGNFSFRIHRITNSMESIPFNQTIVANISTPGQVRVYSFNLVAPARVMMDNLQSATTLRWTLSSPERVYANNFNFSTGGWYLYDLPSGPYQLTVSAPGDDIGSTPFRLIELESAAVPMNLNSDISITFTPPSENKVFKFTGQAGQQIYFDALAHNGWVLYSNPFWLLLSPRGEIVFDSGVTDRGPLELPETGEYRLVLSGNISEPQPTAGSTFRVNDAPVHLHALTLDVLATNRLTVAGERDRYAFTIVQPTEVIFDSLTNSALRWTLTGPKGELMDRPFNSSDGNNHDSFMQLVPGGYVLEVAGSGDDTGGYAFVLRTLSSGEPLVLNTTVNGSLNPASVTRLFRFNASAGDRVRFQAISQTGLGLSHWRLRDPAGEVVWGGYFGSSTHSNQLDRTGVFTLQLEGNISEAGNGTFSFSTTTFTPALPPPPTGTPIVLDQIVSNTLPASTTVHSYLLTLTQPTRLYIDYLRTLDNFSWALIGPNGPVHRMHPVTGSVPATRLPPGSYELQWTGTAAPYAFRVLSFESAPLLTIGAAITNRITPSAGASLYRVPLAAEQRLYFDVISETGFSSSPAKWLLAPAGNSEFVLTSFGDFGRFTNNQSGDHFLILDGPWGSPGATGTVVFALNPIVDHTNAATLGATINGALAPGGGSVDTWTFSLTQASRIFVDVLYMSSFNWEWLLTGPAGDETTGYRSPTSVDGLDANNSSFLLGPGDYQLRIRSTTTQASSYSLRLINASEAPVMVPGTTVAAAVVPGSGTALYRFNAVAGQQVYYDYLTQVGSGAVLRLFSPSGVIIQSQGVNTDLDTFVLPLTGEYVLSIEGRYNEDGPGSTNTFVYRPIQHLTNTVAPDQWIAGSMSTPGIRHVWNFSLPTPQLVWFDALTNTTGATWTLARGPNLLLSRGLNSSDSIDQGNSLLGLLAGDYTITMVLGNNVGAYAFRLVSQTNATPFTPGAPVTVTLDPPMATRVMTFNGMAGDRYFFDGIGYTGSGSVPPARLYAPNGELLWSRNVNDNEPTFTLPLTGPYFLSIESRVSDPGPARTVTFALIPNPPKSTLPLGEESSLPDLVVPTVAINPPAGLRSGDPLTISWTVRNSGAVTAAVAFTDRILVRNVALNQILINTTLSYEPAAAGNGPIAPGSERPRQIPVILPAGATGAGNLEVVVTADTLNQMPEYNALGTGEANNSKTFNFATTLAPYPDLQILQLSANPPTNWAGGTPVQLTWTVTNSGPASASTSWVDRVLVRNLSRSTVLLSSNVSHLLPVDGPLSSGNIRARSATFVVPSGANGQGEFEISIESDALGQVTEAQLDGSGETNNIGLLTVRSAPNLQVINPTVTPSPAISGADILVQWSVQNAGNAPVESSFSDRVAVRRVGDASPLITSSAAYNIATAGNGPIPPGGTRARSLQVRLPDGPAGVGTFAIEVTADSLNQIVELTAVASGENDNLGQTTLTTTLAPYPDLRAAAVTVLPSSPQSGQEITVRWEDRNDGTAAAPGSWNDRVQLLDAAGAAVADTTVYQNASTLGPLPGNAGRLRQQLLRLPHGVSGAGTLRAVVTIDSQNAVFEYNSGGNAESNNTASSTFTATLANYPDLAVASLQIAPASIESGDQVTVRWSITNAGTGPVTGDFSDRLLVRNLTLGTTVHDQYYYFNPVADTNGPIVPGTNLVRTATLRLPDGAAGAGNMDFTVFLDAGNRVFEYRDSADAETNNIASLDRNSTLAIYPDLAVSNVSAPASGLPGQSVIVQWTVANLGAGVTPTGRNDQIYLVDDANPAAAQLLATIRLDTPVAAGASSNLSQSVPLPYFAVGSRRLAVRANSGPAYYETSLTNNYAASTTAIQLNPRLDLALNRSSAPENSGSNSVLLTVLRNGTTSGDLAISLNSTLPELAAVPPNVIIPAGQASRTVPVAIANNGLVDGSRSVRFSAAATGYAAGQADLVVLDDDIPILTFQTSTASVDEDAGANAVMASITRNGPTNVPLVITLTSDAPSRLLPPPTLMIPAGARVVTFSIAAPANTGLEGDATVHLQANATNYTTAAVAVFVRDNDVPQLSLVLAATSISEGAESPATTAVLSRQIAQAFPLLVALNQSTPGLLFIPPQITIPAGQASIGFNVNVSDDQLVNGTRVDQLIARAFGASGVPITNGQAVAGINIFDNDGPTLTLALASDVVNENGSVQATVTRNTGTTGSLVVSVASSDAGEATPAAPTVTIPNGATSVSITVQGVPDGLNDGIQQVLIAASAPGYNSATARLNVSDIDLPDLAVGDIIVPSSGQIDARANVTFTVANSGPVAATGTWIDRVYISTDNQLGGDILAGSVTNTAPLLPGSSYTRTVSIKLPADPSHYHIIVVADTSNQVTEGNERNNVISVATIDVQPNYRASVETEVVSAPCGTAIPIHGRAFNPEDNSPARFKFVTVRILKSGTRRLFNVLTDTDGAFSLTFTPLPTEAGHYQLAADHPRVNEDTPQDSFTLLGFGVGAEAATMTIVPLTPISGEIALQNMSSVPLTGLTAIASNAPAALGLQLQVPSTLPGHGFATLAWSMNTTITNAARVVFPVEITAAEGCHQRVLFTVNIAPLRPQLVAEPAFIERGVVRGVQTLVTFSVRNIGGVDSGPIDLLAPSVDWLTLAGTNRLESMAPGASTTVTMLLNPPNDLPLIVYTGTIGIGNERAALAVPFRFRAVSTAVGDLRVTATDDYTYYVAGNPKLTNAAVSIIDPYGGAIVTNGVTDASGEVRFANLPEGAYTVQVTAPKHNTFRGTATIQPGSEADIEAFLARQTVSYRWTVVPLEIQDRYRVVLESVFETEVPIPNVIVEEPYIMPLVFQGETNQFEIALRNEGLIAAENVEIIVPDHPDFRIEPLVRKIGTIPAKTRLVIPVLISQRVGGLPAAASGGDPLFQPAGEGCEIDTAPCLPKIPLGVHYYYVCGNNGVLQQRSIDLSPVCLAKDIKDCIEKTLTSAESLHSFRNGGNAAKFACDLLEAVLQCAGVNLSPCQSAALSIACGAATGGLAGAAGGAAGGSSLECICGLIKNISISIPSAPPNYGTVNYVNGSLIGSMRSGFNGYPWSAGYLIGGSCNSPASAGNGAGPMFSPASGGGVCARVRLQIDQEAVLTRVAFKGSLEIDNDSGNPITGIQLTLDMRDTAGEPAGDRFVVRPPVVTGMGNVDGTGTVAAFGTGSAEYLFIPTRDAAPTAPAVYRIGGSLRYLDGGQEVVVPLSSATITVYPEARLQLHYFQSRNVFSDDPFTPEVEPSEPFALGLLARNVGAGDARNFRITSAQPKIIENEKGLLIDFKIIGSQVGSNSVEPSLTVPLGTIPAGRSQVAQWLMTSTLQGKFIEYKATFEHIDNFGSTNLSLIDSVEIHELIHPVLADRPGDDRSPDFLANDIPDAGGLPDILHLSDGTTALVEARTAGTFSNGIGAGARQTTLTFTAPASWVYVELADPGPGWQLYRVIRSDNKNILAGTNAWTTDRTFPSGQTGSRREHRFHLLDYNSTGNYTLFYRPVDTNAPVLVSLGPVSPSFQTTAIDTIDVVFSEEIDPATLDVADLTLTLNDGPNRITGAVQFTPITTNRFSIGGLTGLTAADGNYRITINAAGISDFAGNMGQGTLTSSWAKGTLAPVITALGPIVPNPRNTPVNSIEVVFSRSINEATFTRDALLLTRNGGANLINSSVTVEFLDTNRFLISGLTSLTQPAGEYRLTVLASGVEDSSGNLGAGLQFVTWSTLNSGPQIVSFEQPVTNPRNIAVASLEVVFAAPINSASFDWQDLQLTRDGGPNLITSAVTVQPITPARYRLGNFNWVIGSEGRYVFTVNASGIVDPAGNLGSGSASAQWTMDTTRPPVPAGLNVAPDLGVSTSDGLINTLTPTLSGTIGETNLTVRIRNLTTGVDYGPADVTGLGFQKALSLGTAGAHKLEIHTVDAAGNTSFPQLLFDVFVDLTQPSAEIAPVVPRVRNSAVDALQVTFSEPIHAATFTRTALSLRRQSGPNLINPGVQIVNVTSNQYRITGLTSLTDTAGAYEFALNMAAVQDRAGNSGTNVVSVSWSRTGANQPPSLDFVPDRTATVGTTIIFTNVATDADAGQTLRFSLNPDAPSNIRLGETSGVFRWSPTRSQSPGTYTVVITVTDDGVPPASTSRSFTVAVDEFTETSLGEAVVMAGESGTVPLALVSTAGLTNLLAEITVPTPGLTAPQLGGLSPLVAKSSLQDLGNGRYRVSLTSQPGQSIRGSNLLAQLQFGTTAGQTSAFLPLPLANITARQPDGTAVGTTFTRDGRVIVVGEQPLLELLPSGDALRLRLFAHPGDVYDLESATNVNGSWNPLTRVRFTEREMNWLPPFASAGTSMEFYRLVGVDVSAPFFEVKNHDATGLGVIFYGERGRTFDLETTDRLGAGTTWNLHLTKPMTNNFHELRLNVPPGEARFLRAREH